MAQLSFSDFAGHSAFSQESLLLNHSRTPRCTNSGWKTQLLSGPLLTPTPVNLASSNSCLRGSRLCSSSIISAAAAAPLSSQEGPRPDPAADRSALPLGRPGAEPGPLLSAAKPALVAAAPSGSTTGRAGEGGHGGHRSPSSRMEPGG